MSTQIAISTEVNGKSYTNVVEPRLLLVHYLREVLGLTGTHIGCDTSQCGACTVLMNGKPVKSCTILAVQAHEREIKTIEGLAPEKTFHPLQDAFWTYHGLQCGYCTPGMIMVAYGFLARSPEPTEKEVRHALEGNLCRCTGYQNIVTAIMAAADVMKKQEQESR